MRAISFLFVQMTASLFLVISINVYSSIDVFLLRISRNVTFCLRHNDGEHHCWHKNYYRTQFCLLIGYFRLSLTWHYVTLNHDLTGMR